MTTNRESVIPLKRDDYQIRKPPLERDSRNVAMIDGPRHPAPERIAGMIAVHIENGEWGRARSVLDLALDEAKREAESKGEKGPLSVEQIGIALRTCAILGRHGFVWADDLARLSEEQLFELRDLGPKMVAEIQLALRRAGLAK